MPNIKDQFPQDPAITYLNHAAVSPWPRCTADAVTQFSKENVFRGATDYPGWLKTEANLRQQLARLIGAPSTHNIALQKNTSEGLSVIAYGLEWQAGDQVVISDQEFPSNRIVWESLQQFGVKIVEVDISVPDPEASIIKHLTPKVRLLSISSVQYGTGLVLDLDRLGQACATRDTLFCVDAIQSLGALPFDVTDCKADFVVADGHKWMMGPEGVALLYLSDRVLNSLKLNQYGWHMVQDRGNYDVKTWQSAIDATRYECGSPNMLGAVALSSSIGLLLDIGLDQVHSELMARMDHLERRLQEITAIDIITDTSRSLRSGILTFRHSQIESLALQKQLQSAGVICAYRGGGIRFSPHFYTPLDQLDKAVDLIPR
ncbi:aminotransferase class V-fold PLP-dependent enzyme [Ketobacter sp. MCCC 1A13808]|uniref:aminotransferase class V-fold PLP-dependent enzyme n=1 Tax=Ketobacter sp. MCCC 1A13808 TaxID=2602738 RepID=UPI000F0F1B2A|nr:aminotransferase class V-fold PLP-dependent enzyme [Ketobacter sp. MCCC 1A13808]MVF10674.1 aminotransferase class V-fold PLP-dependent enzyme [Ketobacter sp. MCCC 1A13808]RLP56094.1 MAG: aminotransferase class V-fold PLP-dependent enzyme [Ketobacter sp.]